MQVKTRVWRRNLCCSRKKISQGFWVEYSLRLTLCLTSGFFSFCTSLWCHGSKVLELSLSPSNPWIRSYPKSSLSSYCAAYVCNCGSCCFALNSLIELFYSTRSEAPIIVDKGNIFASFQLCHFHNRDLFWMGENNCNNLPAALFIFLIQIGK